MVNKGVVERSLIESNNHRKAIITCPRATSGACGAVKQHRLFEQCSVLALPPHSPTTGDRFRTCWHFNADSAVGVSKVQGDGLDVQVVRINLVGSSRYSCCDSRIRFTLYCGHTQTG